jgi:hypothetical protein
VPAGGRFEQFIRFQLGQPGAGALQSALDRRGGGGGEDLRGFGRGERQHLAQDEDRPLAGGQVLQACDERQPHRLARNHHRGRIVGGRGNPLVRQRFQPRDLARRNGTWRAIGSVVRARQALGQHPGLTRFQRRQADVGAIL